MEILGLAILCGLADWRLASLLHTEDAFEWLRRWIGIENDKDGYPVSYPSGFLGNTFNCFWCLSLLAGMPIILSVALVAKTDIVQAVLLWLASSAVAIYWEKQIMRTNSR